MRLRICHLSDIHLIVGKNAILLQKSEVNSLLKYRIETVYRILNDMRVLKDKVSNHHDRVEWQIQVHLLFSLFSQ